MAGSNGKADPDDSSARGANGAQARSAHSRVISPDAAAREELVRWCGEHGLPVPPAQPSRRAVSR